MKTTFGWNDWKEEHNIQRHGIRFKFAELVFSDDARLTEYQGIRNGEERWLTVGRILGLVLVVAHTIEEHDDHEHIHIISARRATKKERARFFKEINGR